MTSCAESAAYASIVSAARVTIVPSVASAKTAWMPSVSAATAAQTVRRFVRTAVKNAKTAPMTSCAVNAASALTVSAARAIIVPSAVFAKTVWNRFVSAVTAAQTVQRFVRTAVKNAKTVPMTRCAESAVYASIVSAVRATTARNAASAKTAWMPSVSAVTAAQTVQRSVRTVTKSVQTVPRKKSAVDATSVRIAQAVTETSAITAKPARCALNLFVSAEAGAQSVQSESVPNAMKNAVNVPMMNYVLNAASAVTVQAKKTSVPTAEFATTVSTWSVSAAADARTAP